MFERLGRIRHSKGFGIHSPFAFDFIVNTLRDTGCYYLYEDLDRLEHLKREEVDFLKLIVRVVTRLHPAEVWVHPRHRDKIWPLLNKIDHNIKLTTKAEGAHCMVILFHDDLKCPDVTRILEDQGSVVVADRRSIEGKCRSIEVMTAGVYTFEGLRHYVAVGRGDFVRQRFKLIF